MSLKTLLCVVTLVSLAFLQSFVSSYDNGLAAKPIMGWSSWCTNDLCGIPDRCSEYEVRNKADAMVKEGMTALGYKWMLLDDCWSHTERDANGELQPSPHLFPSGMKALADYVHSKGMYLGLYTCVGTETCKKKRPGSYGHYVTDANTMAKWGIDMVKADYCHKPGNETGQSLYTQFSQALNATGRPMLFSMCQWGNDDVVEWGGSISQMYRIQMDHIPFWTWGPHAAGVGYGQGTKEIINFMADLHPSKYNKPHAWMDPDFLESLFFPWLGKWGMDYTNSRTEFTFWCLWSSPLLVATDPVLSDEKRQILMNEELVAIDQDDSPAGERIRNDNTTTGGQVWMRTMSNKDVVVVLYNSGDNNDVKVTATWAELGLASDLKLSVRNVWEKVEMGIVTGQVEATLKAHDVALYRMRLP